jgi:nitrite reductase/ring-hydroxylating ferredoxin subunit
MTLANLISHLPIRPGSSERWAVLGPEADHFGSLLHPAQVWPELQPGFDGLVLAGALSAQPATATWLAGQLAQLKAGATLIAIDWQADGPPEPGPDLDQRFGRGRLCRQLRDSGFAVVQTLINQACFYLVKALKQPQPVSPYAGQFVVVADLAELPKNGMKVVELFGHSLIVANTGREIVAFAQSCPHAAGHFDQGRLRGRNVVCPVHFYIWNVLSGEPVEPADEDILPRYPVRVDPLNQKILVALAE